jgi:hypothetical protein
MHLSRMESMAKRGERFQQSGRAFQLGIRLTARRIPNNFFLRYVPEDGVPALGKMSGFKNSREELKFSPRKKQVGQPPRMVWHESVPYLVPVRRHES